MVASRWPYRLAFAAVARFVRRLRLKMCCPQHKRVRLCDAFRHHGMCQRSSGPWRFSQAVGRRAINFIDDAGRNAQMTIRQFSMNVRRNSMDHTNLSYGMGTTSRLWVTRNAMSHWQAYRNLPAHLAGEGSRDRSIRFDNYAGHWIGPGEMVFDS